MRLLYKITTKWCFLEEHVLFQCILVSCVCFSCLFLVCFKRGGLCMSKSSWFPEQFALLGLRFESGCWITRWIGSKRSWTKIFGTNIWIRGRMLIPWCWYDCWLASHAYTWCKFVNGCGWDLDRLAGFGFYLDVFYMYVFIYICIYIIYIQSSILLRINRSSTFSISRPYPH